MAKLPTTKTPANKPEKPKTESADTRLARLEATQFHMLRWLEKTFGKDINKDGKIGSTRVCLIVALFTVLTAGLFAAVAGEIALVGWEAREGNGGYMVIKADDGDDTTDELRIGIRAGTNNYYVSIGGTDVLVITSAGAATLGSVTIGADTNDTATINVHHLNWGEAPTTTNGLNPGDFWSDSGTLKIK